MLLLVVLMPVALATQTNIALTYDANGNLLTNGDKRYVYDGFNRLAEVFINNSIKEKYWYDPDGQRLKKVEFHGDGSNTTIYYISKSFVRIINSSGTYDEVYYYDEYDLIAKKDSEGKKFYHPDHLGSTTLVTNEAGEVVEETVYDPFGAVQEGGDQRFDYEGKETDFSGLQHFGARYYDPGKPKRWTQPDTLLPDVYDPQQLNRYSFERNNPYKHEDNNGNVVVLAIMIAGIVGATINTALYLSSHNSPSIKGISGYALAGFIQGSTGIISPISATIGGVTSSGIERFADEKELFNNEGFLGYSVSGIISSMTFGVTKYFPMSREYLIKKPTSYLTTKTGKIFIEKQILSNILSELGAGTMEEFGNSLMSYSNQRFGVSPSLANQVISHMRESASSNAVFGKNGGHGFVSGIGYVTSDGRTYPTSNPDWKPKDGT